MQGSGEPRFMRRKSDARTPFAKAKPQAEACVGDDKTHAKAPELARTGAGIGDDET